MRWSTLIFFFFSLFLSLVPINASAQTFDQCKTVHNSGKYSEAEICWRKLIQRNSSNAQAHYYLGQALRNQAEELGDLDDEQKLDDAIDAYKQAIQLKGNDYAWAWNGLANTLHLQKKSDEAIEAYRQALQSTNIPGPPTSAYTVAHCNLGSQLEIQGRRLKETGRQINNEIARLNFEEAIDQAQKGIQLDSKHDHCWVTWGDALSSQRKYEAAIEKYRQATTLDTQNAYAYVMWGRALSGLGKLNDAIEKYRQATQINTKEAQKLHAWAYVEWGDVLWLQAKYEDASYQQIKIGGAIDKYQRALDSPNDDDVPTHHAFAHNGLGVIYWRLGDLENAKAEFENAIEPDSPLDFPQSNYNEVERLLQLKAGKQFLPVNSTRYLPPNEQTATKRSVVKVVTRFWERGVEYGTGWVMSRQGNKAWIVTNKHVIFNGNRDGDEIKVEPYYGDIPDNLIPSRLNAGIVNKTQKNEALDLAVLEVEFSDVPSDVQSLSMDSGGIGNNTPVSIVGNIDFRWLSGVLKEVSPYELMLEPLLEGGNSGSPVLNSQNQVMGLVYASDPDRETGQNSYAYPIELVINKIRQWGIPRS